MKLEEFMREWPHRKIFEGKSFSDVLTLEGIPLWWFFNRFFVAYVMPRQLNTFKEIESGKILSSFDRTKLALSSTIFRKYIQVKERRKFKFLKQKPEYTNEKKALFLTYTNHLGKEDKLFRIQRIIEKTRERGHIKELTLFADALSSNRYEMLRKKRNIYQYYNNEIGEKAKKTAEELHGIWRRIGTKQKRDMLNWEELQLWDYLKYAFNFFFSKELLTITIIYYYLFKEILVRENVKVIVITSQSSIFEKGLIAASQKLKIPVLRVQHGIREDIVPPDKYDLQNNYFYKLVFSEFIKKEAMKVGWPNERVIVVGPVIFDGLIRFRGAKNKKEKNILFATMPAVQTNVLPKNEYLKRVRFILKEMKKIEGTKLKIKLHPRELPKEESIKNYEQIVRELNFEEAIVIGGDIIEEKFYELMKWCDVFISFGSTSATEAMIVGRPAVTINAFGEGLSEIWNRLTIAVEWNGDVSGAIKKALLNNKEIRARCERYIEKRCGNIDGKASENVAKLLEKMSN